MEGDDPWGYGESKFSSLKPCLKEQCEHNPPPTPQNALGFFESDAYIEKAKQNKCVLVVSCLNQM